MQQQLRLGTQSVPAQGRTARKYAAPVRVPASQRRVQCRAEQNQGQGLPAEVSLRIPYHVHFGQCLAVVGSGEHLGNWNPGSAIKMTWTEGDYWVAELHLKTLSDTELEYKYLVLNPDGNLGLWKPGSNFKLEIPPGARVKVEETWMDGPRNVEVDVTSLQTTNGKPGMLATKSAIQQQTDTAMHELEYALEQQCATLDRSKDPASQELIFGDRLLAAAGNKAMAFQKASKAAEVLPQLPGTREEKERLGS